MPHDDKEKAEVGLPPAATQEAELNDCWNQIGVWRSRETRCPELARVIHCRNCPVYAAAGRSLLRRPLDPERREDLTLLLAHAKKPMPPGTRSAFVFRAGGEWLALAAGIIREVVDMGPIHSIPHLSNNILRGLVNIHGKLEICVSIGGVLGIDKLEKSPQRSNYVAPERLVVSEQEGRLVAFPVSEVLGIVRYGPEMIKELPVTVAGSKAAYTQGILCLPDRDVGLLKDKPLFSTLTKDLL
jgi:chemotaxis-related protein WspD